jgi:serine/threonine-protein kinase
VTDKGDRIDGPAPVEIVNDPRAVSGTPAIVNGLSCMSCHRQGMISEFRDEIRNSNAVAGKVLQKVQDLYPPAEVMSALTADDEQRFLRALEKTTGPFQKVGDDARKPIGELAEPVGRVAELYQQDLGPEAVALELGLSGVDELKTIVRTNRTLLTFGLGTLVQDPPGTLKRERWEGREGTSLMQDAASQVRRGVTPLSF